MVPPICSSVVPRFLFDAEDGLFELDSIEARLPGKTKFWTIVKNDYLNKMNRLNAMRSRFLPEGIKIYSQVPAGCYGTVNVRGDVTSEQLFSGLQCLTKTYPSRISIGKDRRSFQHQLFSGFTRTLQRGRRARTSASDQIKTLLARGITGKKEVSLDRSPADDVLGVTTDLICFDGEPSE